MLYHVRDLSGGPLCQDYDISSMISQDYDISSVNTTKMLVDSFRPLHETDIYLLL